MSSAMSFTFRPAKSVVARRSAVKSAALTSGKEYAKTLPGITAPFGYFDPLGMSSDVSPAQVKRWREAELTHGRVCMLAAVGFVVGENIEGTNLFINKFGNITGPAINQFQQVPQGFWEPLVIFIGMAEALRVQKGWANPVDNTAFTLKDEYTPGDLGFDPLGMKPSTEAEFKSLSTKELNNGRLAMIGVAGFTGQELVNQKGIFEHLAGLN